MFKIPLAIDSSNIQEIIYRHQRISSVIFNDVQVFSTTLPSAINTPIITFEDIGNNSDILCMHIDFTSWYGNGHLFIDGSDYKFTITGKRGTRDFTLTFIATYSHIRTSVNSTMFNNFRDRNFELSGSTILLNHIGIQVTGTNTLRYLYQMSLMTSSPYVPASEHQFTFFNLERIM